MGVQDLWPDMYDFKAIMLTTWESAFLLQVGYDEPTNWSNRNMHVKERIDLKR